MVHPLASRLAFAASPTELGACPPVWSKVPLICPATSRLSSMLSIDCVFNPVFLKACVKFVAVQLSKALDGKVFSKRQPCHVEIKDVPLLKSNKGNSVKTAQSSHVLSKSSPLPVSINGKLVKDSQPLKALSKLTTFPKFPASVAVIVRFSLSIKCLLFGL